MNTNFSRREFLKATVMAGVSIYGTSLMPFNVLSEQGTDFKKSSVFIINNPNVFVNPEANEHRLAKMDMVSVGEVNSAIDQSELNAMLWQGVQALTGTTSDTDAWKSIFKTSDVVGIKVNCLAGRGLSSHPELVASIIVGLKLAGIKEENIIVWDLGDNHLIQAGYRINRDKPGVRCYGTAGEYDTEPTKTGSFNGRLSKILSEKITALINVPILKDHNLAGITCAMKNHYGSFHNPDAHHGNGCDPFIADLNSVSAIKDKTRLIICDAIKALANGGPGHNPQFVWEPRILLISTDPVALDYQAWQIIEARRKETGLTSLADEGRSPKWLTTAASIGLGTNDPSKIEIVHKVVMA